MRLFVDRARAVLESVGADIGSSRDAAVRSLLIEVRQRGGKRSGSTPSGIGYAVHGLGCRFKDAAGAAIDLDISPDGRPMFDSWRVQGWARSIGREAPSADIVDEALSLVRLGVLEPVREGWWTWASPHDLPG